jgi:hypothetical protein
MDQGSSLLEDEHGRTGGNVFGQDQVGAIRAQPVKLDLFLPGTRGPGAPWAIHSQTQEPGICFVEGKTAAFKVIPAI